MTGAVSIFKKSLKLFAWIILGILILLVSIALLIRIPSIQNKLISLATSYVSKKTNTRVEIKSISLDLPKSINLEGIYLDDENKDTLLYAAKASVNISIAGLLNHKIHIKNILLDHASIHLTREHTDTLFNYNFLLKAFSGSTKVESNDTTKSKWALQIDDIELKSIGLFYHDNYGGSNMDMALGNLKLKMDKIDTDKKHFDIQDLLIENLITSVKVTPSSKPLSENKNNTPPTIKAKRIRINNSKFVFTDSVNFQSALTLIQEFKVKDIEADLNKEQLSLNSISLNQSELAFTRRDTTLQQEETQRKESNWKITAGNIDLNNNKVSYNIENKPRAATTFTADHLNYKNLSLKAESFAYSTSETKVKVNNLRAIDENGFMLSELKTDFLMNQHSIRTKGLLIKTKSSEIKAEVLLGYSSLTSLKDSIGTMSVNAELKKINVRTSDILYFAPALIKENFFRQTANITSLTGTVTGRIDNLKGEKIKIETGTSTKVNTNFIITGLPDAQHAFFYFPDLKINTGRNDIKMIAGKQRIPQSISLPSSISLLINFKGFIKSFTTTIGLASDYGSAHLYGIIDKNENFQASVQTNKFDLGSLLQNNKMFGPVTLTADVSGHSLNKNTITANLKASVPEIYLNQYNYHRLTISGDIKGRRFDGKISLKDENADLDFDGFVDLNKNKEQYKFKLELNGADLQKLHFTNDDMRIGFQAVSDLKGNSAANITGKAGVTKIIISHNDKKYILDSLLFASINESGRNKLNINSAVVAVNYDGSFAPADLASEMKKMLNNYFPVSAMNDTASQKPQNFTFEIQLHNHPVLSEVFFPQLKEFEPGIITGSYNSQDQALKVNAGLRKIVYGSIQLSDLNLNINTDKNALNYSLACSNLSNSQLKLENFSIAGKVENKTITTTISSIDEEKQKKLQLTSYLTKDEETYTFKLDDDFYLMNDKWDIADDNYFSINNTGFLIHDLVMNKSESRISVFSEHDKFNDNLVIDLKNLKLDELSKIIEKDTSIAKGTANGHVLLKRINQNYGLIADASISNLIVKDVPIGNLILKAEDPTAEKFVIGLKLNGPDNDISVNGTLKPKETDNALEIKADIKTLSLKTVQAFSLGKITEASGTASGNFLIKGKMNEPEITGSLILNNATINAIAVNTNMQLKHETVELKKDGFYFKSFTVLDVNNNPAVINGSVKMNHFKDFKFDLDIKTTDFTLFNTTEKNNQVYYGHMIIDSKIKVTGDIDLPVVNAKVKVKKGSNFTFAVPEKKLTTDKGEGIVIFDDSLSLNRILTRDENLVKAKSEITGLNISSVVEVDKEASLRLLIDPTSGDSLVVKGDAALSFALDPSGKMSLTGAYELIDGSYLVALESVIKRKFRIAPGSTIIWNGDPLDANVSINAIYSVRAAPIDLVADQLTGLSETDQSGYKQRYPFDVYLKLRGELMHPDISFEIQLPNEEKGIMGGAVNAKLNMLNEDPSALNKQVFALLVLGRFVQEDPLQTETNAVSNAARTTVGKFLTAQLNQMGSRLVPGVELNFDVQSYDDYESGEAEGRTEVAVGVKKQLFDERLSVQVGGSVDVEGQKAKQNSASDITGDVSLEYKITKDGRYRLKGFRHNQYEGAIEGQLVETGAGVLYVRDFNRWKEFFRRPKQHKDSESKTNDVPISTK